MKYAYHEIELAKSQDFIEKILTNENEDDFFKKAVSYLTCTYNLKE